MRLSYLFLETDKKVTEPASKLRGFIGKKFSEYPILHHHIQEVGFLYLYPRVQYKILEGAPLILGIDEGAEVLKRISSEIEFLRLGMSLYKVESVVIKEKKLDVKPSREKQHYKFLTPWIALNQENYKKFLKIENWKERKEFLNRILVGNILSMCKGLGIVVRKRLYAHSHLDFNKTEYKSIKVFGLTGEFKVNFLLPDYIGLGKGVSQGFGVVKQA